MHLMIFIGKSSGDAKEISLANNINCYYGINGWNTPILNVRFTRICSVLIRNVMAYMLGFKYMDLEAASIESESIVV